MRNIFAINIINFFIANIIAQNLFPYDPWKLSRINDNDCESCVYVSDEKPNALCTYNNNYEAWYPVINEQFNTNHVGSYLTIILSGTVDWYWIFKENYPADSYLITSIRQQNRIATSRIAEFIGSSQWYVFSPIPFQQGNDGGAKYYESRMKKQIKKERIV